jgi:hypothetical protein
MLAARFRERHVFYSHDAAIRSLANHTLSELVAVMQPGPRAMGIRFCDLPREFAHRRRSFIHPDNKSPGNSTARRATGKRSGCFFKA